MIRSSFFLFLIFACSGALAQGARDHSAQIQGISIQADSMDRDTENETVDLRGNVQLIYQDQHLSAERAFINLRAKSIDAVGNVFVTTPKANISGRRIVMDYESNTGVIIDGYVQSGNVIFEGKQIHKLSDVDYMADEARYTTCTTCPEAWSFSGSKIRAEIGGYAYIKNSVMRFASVPVLWLPYLAVPLKSDRQTGVLPPSFGNYGDEGWTFSQSLFWAIDRSHDATFTFTSYEFRGPKGLINYRYVLSPTAGGELDMGFLRDRLFSDSVRYNTFNIPSPGGQKISGWGEQYNRWFIKYNHHYEMPEGFVQRANINYVSDLQYPKDFSRETGANGDPALENRVSLTKNTDNQHWSVDASYYKNLLQSNPLGSNNDAVHRLPELRFSQTQTRLGDSDFIASVDVDYVNFARSGLGYDDLNAAYNSSGTNDRHLQAGGSSTTCSGSRWDTDPSCYPFRDGQFDESKDLIRTGQRLDLQPSIYRPMKFKNLDLLPRLSYRETQYTFPVGDQPRSTRRYVRADLVARTTFSRIYGDFSSLQSERIKHELQPEVSFTAVPWIHHPENRFFGQNNNEDTAFLPNSNISDADLNGPVGIQFDYNDRLYNRKLVTFGVTNKLTRKYWEGGSPYYLQFINWRLNQSYDVFRAERNPKSEPLSALTSDLKVTLQNMQLYQQSSYYPYQRVTNTSTRLRLNNQKGESFQVQHALQYSISPGQDVDIGARTESYIFTAQKNFTFVDLIGKASYGVRPSTFLNAWGYGAQFKLPGDCFYIRLSHYKPIDKKPNIEATALFTWDGNPNSALDESVLAGFGI